MATAAATLARDLTRRNPRWGERVIEWLLRVAGWFSIAVMAAIVVVLVKESVPFWTHVTPWEFFTGTRWAPVLEPQSFGVLPLVCGTFLVAAGAAVIALPLGV